MVAIVTRELGAAPKGSPLDNSEVDNNFINLNEGKSEKYTVIKNMTGGTIIPGTVVYITGSTGANVTVALASASSEATSSKTFAIVVDTILNNETGRAVRNDIITGLDTSAYTEGSAIWLSTTDGAITTTKPTPPNHTVFLGYVVRSHASAGAILVKILNGYEIEELHNVLFSSLAGGDVLEYNSTTSLWVNATPTSTNTASRIVKRDASGNFSAGTITAALSGNASTATTLQTVRTINGTSFNGSANITTSSWGTARTVTIGSTGKSVDGSANVSWTIAEIGAIPATEKGAVNGVATLGSDGKVPSGQLPSFVDDVLEYANLASFPVTGETAKIYVALDTNKTYRWSGSAYVYITSGAVDSVNGMTGVVTISTITGNAGSATALQTSRNINGTPFNGSADITTARWGTSRTLSFTGDVTGSSAVDGSGDVATAMILANSGVTAGSYGSSTAIPVLTIDAKGRITAASTSSITVGNGTLTLGVSGVGLSGSQTFTANQSDAATFTVTSNATSANTAGAIVSRDASGNFSANTISASLSGNATTATSSPLLAALGNYVWSASTLPMGFNQGIQASFVSDGQGFPSYGSVMTMNTYSGGGGALQLYVPYSNTYGGNGLRFRSGDYAVSNGNAWTSWKVLLDSSNYNSYSPTLTGGGASGTWSISITGSAATVGTIGTTQVTTLYSPNGATVVSPDTASAMPAQGQSFIHTLGTGPSGNDGHILGMSWANTTSIYGAQIWLDTDPTNRMAIRSRSSAGVWNGWSEVLTSNNYTSYSPSLTGSGASGTWAINITGNAASATNSSQLNGISSTQLFNNMGQAHGTQTDFNAISDFGVRYVQGTTNGPGTGSQYYGFTIGLGNDYAYSSYASQLYWPRTPLSGSPYLSVRFREGGSWGSWSKIYAGYADTAGNGGVTSVNGQTGAVTVSSGISTINYNNDSNSTYQMLWGSGNAIYGTAGIYCNPSTDILYASQFQATSDERLKTNWRELGEDFVRQLATVKHGVYDRLDIDLTQVGVSAQSLQRVLGESVSIGQDGMLSVNYGNAALVSSIQLAIKFVKLEDELSQIKEKLGLK